MVIAKNKEIGLSLQGVKRSGNTEAISGSAKKLFSLKI